MLQSDEFRNYNVDGMLVVDEEQIMRSLSLLELATPKTKTTLGIPTANHKASVTALNCLESPLRLLVSGSRDGIVKVWR